MPRWITACGIGGIGVVYGYVLFYVLKRYLPPFSQTPPAIKELVLSLASLGGGGAIGAFVTSLDGINYIGPYGLGLLVGAATNVIVTLCLGLAWYRDASKDSGQSASD